MKIVAVSQRVDFLASRNERRDALDQNLVNWLRMAGCLAVPVPNTLITPSADSIDQWLQHVAPQAIILSGGNDLGEIPERDATECRLLDWASSRRLPVLAICRGMQMMGVYAGGCLSAVNGHVRTRHLLQGEYGGITVNSYHHLALTETPPGFRRLAQAEDGALEAIRHIDLPWLGWMWHPERDAVFAPEQLALFRDLIA